MKKFFLLLFLLFAANLLPAQEAYLFSYFTGRGEDGLHLAYSRDGLEWTALNKGASYLAPVVGEEEPLMRDPSIVQGPDGTFHLVWTTGWWDKGIGYASSRDLIEWSEQRFIPVMAHEPEARNTWAPELFYDENSGLFYIIWASTIPGRYPQIETTPNEEGLNHRQYYVTTRDFETFSETELFYDPGFSVIDAAIVKKDGLYWMVVKNEESVPAEKNLRVVFTDDLSKGFPTEASANISGRSWAEGPAPLVIRDSVYVYFDKYREKRYGAIRSADGRTWEDISDQVKFPSGVRHGTAFRVSPEVLDNLLAH